MRCKFAGVAIVIALMTSFVVGQSTFGSIVGVVYDKSQAVVPGASVELRDLGENSTRSTTSDQNGAFEFRNLKPGKYALVVKAENFSDFRVGSAELTARQELRIDATLGLKSRTDVVEVTATAASVNTENATIADSKNTSEITQLPLNFRASTTSPLAALQSSADVQYDSQGNLALAGATANMVGYSVDGISTTNIFFSAAGVNPYPSSEGISELKVTAFNNSAEFAQVGDVTFTTKSGTNEYHGSLFEYLQNDSLDAKVLNFNTKAPKHFNTFGGSLGGPVKIPRLYDGKNKTFFFVDYEGNRDRISTPEQLLVPTQEQRNGNLNGLTIPNGTLLDPNTCIKDPTQANGFKCQAFPGNTIPANRLNPSSLALLNNFYPLPNVPITSVDQSFNFEKLVRTPSDTNGFDARVDHNITSKQQVYARFNRKNLLFNTLNPLLPTDANSEHDRSLLVSHNYQITPTLINEFRYGFTHSILAPEFAIQGAQAIAQLQLQGIDVSHHPTDGGFPTINFSDGTNFSPIGRDHVGNTISSTKQIADNFTYIRGRHSFRTGVDMRWVRFEVPEIETPSDDYGLFTFNQSAFTGNAFGDFLLGIPNTSFFAVTGPRNNAGGPELGLYGQDEWQVNSRLTVTAGLRWQWLPGFVDVHGIQANFDVTTGNTIINDNLINTLGLAPGFLQSFNACSLPDHRTDIPCGAVVLNTQVGLPKGLRQTYMRNFDPRVSFAYRPFNNNQTVIRAGFGIYTVINLGQLQNNNESNPQSSVHTFVNQIRVNGPPLFQFPQTTGVITLGGGILQQATDPRYRDPQSAQWNVTVEREITPSTVVRASYVGMNSYRLNVSVNWNQIRPSTTPFVPSPFVDPRAPFQNWGVIYSTENYGGSNYQAMQLEATHRFTRGLYFKANYTWAHNLSDAQGDAPNGFAGETAYGLAVLNYFDISANRGNVAGDRRHRFLLSGTYELPAGHGRQWLNSTGILDKFLGGWNFNTITLLETGPYLTPIISPTLDQSNTNPLGDGSIVRPDLVGDPTANLMPGHVFNFNAFAPTPAGAGRIGNAGVGILEAPGTIAVSGGLAKTIALHENFRMRFEATFQNLLNHTNWAPPAVNVSDPQHFGELKAQQTAEGAANRTGQLALRIDF